MTTLNYTANALSEFGAVFLEIMILQYVVAGVPDKYLCEKRVLAGGNLEQSGLIARTHARYKSLRGSKSIPDETYVARHCKAKKGKLKDNH